MPYVHPEYWKRLVKEIHDEMLDIWIDQEEKSIPVLKELATRGSPDSPIYTTIAIYEADLALYKEEKAFRLAQKKVKNVE